MIEAEAAREVAGIAERLGAEGEMDLEAAEFFVRTRTHRIGARALEAFLAERLRCEEAPVCKSKHLPATMRLHERRSKTIQTILGPIAYTRGRFVCPVCGAVRYPADEALGVAATGFSPGARRMMAWAGACEAFAQAGESLHLYAALDVDAKDVERMAHRVGGLVEAWQQRRSAWAVANAPADAPEKPDTLYVEFDGTGVPMRGKELEGRAGKGTDGQSRTREVKLGCVFTQSGVDEEGRAVREEASASYVGAIENSTDFGCRIHGEAVRRGMRHARRVVVITDGAAYNKTIVAEHFPNALHIIDLYHAREHLADFARDAAQIPLDSPWFEEACECLNQGRIEELIARMREHVPRSGKRRKPALDEINYFRKNTPHMRYADFRSEGLFIGSGVIEAACRTVVAQRLKNSGMRWSLQGANAIIALRCVIKSKRFEQFWEDAA